jgi:hypothetical protein
MKPYWMRRDAAIRDCKREVPPVGPRPQIALKRKSQPRPRVSHHRPWPCDQCRMPLRGTRLPAARPAGLALRRTRGKAYSRAITAGPIPVVRPTAWMTAKEEKSGEFAREPSEPKPPRASPVLGVGLGLPSRHSARYIGAIYRATTATTCSSPSPERDPLGPSSACTTAWARRLRCHGTSYVP